MVEGEPHQSVPQPDQTQPLQGRAEGRESLQGPTTVGGSEAGERGGGVTPQVEQSKSYREFKGAYDNCPFNPRIFPPSEIHFKYPFEITQEQAIEEGQPWVERLKKFDRQELERRLGAMEKYKRETFPKLREKYRTSQQAELLNYEMEAIRAELRQRGRD